MFRQCLEGDAADENGVRREVWSPAAAKYMDSAAVDGAVTAVATVAASNNMQRSHCTSKADLRQASENHVHGDHLGERRSRARLQADEEYTVPRASVQVADLEYCAIGQESRAARKNTDELNTAPESEAGILLSTAELAAIASLYKVVGASFKDR